ncbi:fluoride efflux transporter CrcB [Bacillus andreraoultii]|uniref:fluoride efflux transporter CrcB n=1 Tax=Bacillus andreraoultii TaxID=1499685 RepID=UPI000539A3DB|nr:fluoride efflux transporter CrcB [Bacillus andreraoultii]
MNGLLVAIGGFFGAICRYYMSSYFNKKWGYIPLGTLFVNIVGSFLLGVLLVIEVKSELYLVFGVGFLGAFTTFSTFIVEISKFLETKQSRQAIIYLIVSIILGMIAAIVGVLIGRN